MEAGEDLSPYGIDIFDLFPPTLREAEELEFSLCQKSFRLSKASVDPCKSVRIGTFSGTYEIGR